MSSLLPPTPEMTAHVLAQGGALPIPAFEPRRDRTTINGKKPAPADTSDSIDVQSGTSPATAIDITSPRPWVIDISSPTCDQGPSSHKSPTPSSPLPSHSHVQHSSTANSNQGSVLLSSLESDPRFTSLLAETQAYLSGPNFAYALTCALDRAMGVLVDGLRARVFVDAGNTVNAAEGDASEHRDRDGQETSEVINADTEVPEEELKIRLVGLLPGLARWSQLALNSTPNELVDVSPDCSSTITFPDFPWLCILCRTLWRSGKYLRWKPSSFLIIKTVIPRLHECFSIICALQSCIVIVVV